MRHKERQQGFAMMDVLAAITIFALLIPGMVTFMQLSTQSTEKKVAAEHMSRVAAAAEQYVMDNHASIVSSATGSTSVSVSLSDLDSGGYLPSGHAGQNPWNQSYSIHALNPEDQDIHLILMTTGGKGYSASNTDFATKVVPSAAAMIGSQGGYIPTGDLSGESTNVVQGAFGGWSFDLSGTDISNPGAGHLAYSRYVDQDQYGNDYLYRDEVPGHPEVNRMTTELDMDGNTIQMGDGNVGGEDGEGARKVNFEDHEAGDFTCSDNDDYGGSVFYDRSEGLFVCKRGEKVKVSDSLNTSAFKSVQIVGNEETINKPSCGSGGDTQATDPRVYVMPVHYSADNTGRYIKSVQTWAQDLGGSWRAVMRVLTDQGWMRPGSSYGKMMVLTECY